MQQKLIAALKSILADFKAVKVKFSEKGIEPLLIDEYFDLFKKHKNKIKEIDHKNIDNWGKKPYRITSHRAARLYGISSFM